MTRDEHRAHIQNLLRLIIPERQGEASEILTTLSEDYDTTLATSEASATRVAELTQSNETLRRVNTDLFLKVGNTNPTPAPKPGEPTPPAPDKDEKGMTFEELFNEKGELN